MTNYRTFPENIGWADQETLDREGLHYDGAGMLRPNGTELRVCAVSGKVYEKFLVGCPDYDPGRGWRLIWISKHVAKSAGFSVGRGLLARFGRTLFGLLLRRYF